MMEYPAKNEVEALGDVMHIFQSQLTFIELTVNKDVVDNFLDQLEARFAGIAFIGQGESSADGEVFSGLDADGVFRSANVPFVTVVIEVENSNSCLNLPLVNFT